MAKLFGEQLTKSQINERVGCLSQIAGVRESRLTGGRADGLRAVDIKTGGGLSFTVLPDRGLDIPWAEFDGIPVCFVSKSGVSRPEYFIPDRELWGGSFYGGLLTTCGLTQVGGSCVWQGRRYPVHGDVANLPAEQVGLIERWEGDELILGVQGAVRQATLYRERLELRRSITASLGGNTIMIRDEVENLGFETQPLMLLYHINFGYPMIGPDTELVLDAFSTKPGGGLPDSIVKDYASYHAPASDAVSLVYHHDLRPDDEGRVSATLLNRRLGLSARISYDKRELKNFTQWKLLGRGDYVTGLEPCNNYGLGVAYEQENGTLEQIEPGETRTFEVMIEFSRG